MPSTQVGASVVAPSHWPDSGLKVLPSTQVGASVVVPSHWPDTGLKGTAFYTSRSFGCGTLALICCRVKGTTFCTSRSFSSGTLALARHWVKCDCLLHK